MSVYMLKVILGSSKMRSSFKFILCQLYPLGKLLLKKKQIHSLLSQFTEFIQV